MAWLRQVTLFTKHSSVLVHETAALESAPHARRSTARGAAQAFEVLAQGLMVAGEVFEVKKPICNI